MAAGESEVRKGPWTLEEDSLLLHYIACHGEGRWNLLARSSGLRRTGKSCRLRWLNYLKPDVKRGNLSPQEQLLILELHSRWGNRWSKIAQHLPGRTDNEIKNYWRTRVQKHARQLNIDSNSTRFQDTVRCLWIPRLLQQMQSASAHSNKSLINSEPAHLLNQPPQATAAPEHLAIYEHNTDSLSVFSDASLLENSGYDISPGSLMGTQIHEMSELSAKNPSTLSNMGMGCNYPFDISSHVGSTPYDVGIFNHASASTPFQIDNISALEYCCMSEDDWVDDMATSCGTWMSFQDHL